MAALRKTAIISLLLLPAFFLLRNYNQIFGFLPISQMTKYAWIIYLWIIAASMLLLFLKVPLQKTILIVFFITFFTLFFGPIHHLMKVIAFISFFGRYKFFLPFYLIIVVIVVRKIFVSPDVKAKNILFLNTIMICLVLGEIVLLLVNNSDLKKTNNLIYPGKFLCEKYISKNLPDSSKPDIYFLLFDEYTNNKMLKKMWNFNNDSITNWLLSNGFFVPGNTKSNYTFTTYSVSSALNMDYIPDIKKSTDATVPLNILQSVKSLSDNETFCILKKEDYKIRFLAPFHNDIENNKLERHFSDLVDDRIYRQTLPGSIQTDILWNFRPGSPTIANDSASRFGYSYKKFKAIQYTIGQIDSSINRESNRKPQFVYAHFMITHEVHIFDSSGNFLADQNKPQNTYYKTYPAQVMYANKVIRAIVARIRSLNKPNTIIILMGDHGFRELQGSGNTVYFPNFCSIYFPDKNYSMLYDSITPINIFRTVFNRFFNQRFPILKDTGILVKTNDITNN
ncbi:MAG: sulfatase-like hydrolase/transferase [Bacteroidetes bacterium]|nr:sulfatase-like hydrolase/transferase [Bacteroidota bacterium]